jgi:hypothetical protein
LAFSEPVREARGLLDARGDAIESDLAFEIGEDGDPPRPSLARSGS